jgi:hypothetical protein
MKRIDIQVGFGNIGRFSDGFQTQACKAAILNPNPAAADIQQT